MLEAKSEMPKYQSHKIVHGLKIAGIEIHQDRSATIAPADEGFAPLVTSAGWADRFKGNDDDLGYFVAYKDGYTSWSPTKEFEEGYTRI